MAFFKNIFWNDEQRRLRMLWRFVGIVLLLPLSLAALQGLLSVLGSILGGSTLNDFITQAGIYDVISIILTFVAIVIAMLVAASVLDRRSFSDFGLHFNRNWWADFGFGLALGAVLMLGIFLIEWSMDWIDITGYFIAPHGQSFATFIIGALLLFIFVGIYEELLFRGYVLRNLAEGFNLGFVGPKWALLLAWLLTSLLFGLAHANNPNATAISTINIAIAGIFLGIGYVITGELAIPIGLHIAWNFFQGNVFGFPVSGTSANVTSFIAVEQGGPELLTGGSFGPEAGLLGLAAMLAGTGLTYLWLRRRYHQTHLDRTLAIYPRTMSESTAELSSLTTPDILPSSDDSDVRGDNGY
ncbi:MAG: CPBP family intramembrane metalloprotease [Chloroflexi bacterium]|nr:CPBP family intramembrane metalloprotease [Chloroflexota bacterium]